MEEALPSYRDIAAEKVSIPNSQSDPRSAKVKDPITDAKEILLSEDEK